MSGLFNPTVAWITFRATMGRRRAFLFLIPAAILIVVTVALKISRRRPGRGPRTCWARSGSPYCCR